MSYTICKDDAVDLASDSSFVTLQVRATISTRAELEELIVKLTLRLQAAKAQEENHEHDARSVRSDLSAPNAIAAGTNLNDGPAKTA